MFDFSAHPAIDYTNEGAMLKMLKSVTTHYNSVKGREHLHLLLDAAARHGQQHNSGEWLTRIFNALPSNANKEGVKTWVHEYTTFKWLKNKDGVLMFLSRDSDNAKVPATYILAGSATPFYDMLKVKAAQDKPYSFLAGLENLLKVAESKVKNGKVGDPVEKMLIAMLADSLPSAIATAKAKVADAAKPADKPANNVVELAA